MCRQISAGRAVHISLDLSREVGAVGSGMCILEAPGGGLGPDDKVMHRVFQRSGRCTFLLTHRRLVIWHGLEVEERASRLVFFCDVPTCVPSEC